MDDNVDSWADMHNQISNDSQGFLSSASDAITKGIPLALASGVVSMYNTGAALGNVLGADIDKVDLGSEVAGYDNDMAQYYKQHQGAIDLGGFLATSLAPGLAGIKALKMLQGGIAGENAATIVGAVKNTKSVLGLGLFKDAEAGFTEDALNTIRTNVNDMYSEVTNQKLLAMAAGAGDQALQGAAFQTAVLLTMNQSPILSKPDESYFTSLVRNAPDILTAGLIQGAFGGAINAVGISGKLKGAVFERDVAELPSKSVKQVGIGSMDPGTALATDFAFLENKVSEFNDAKEAGTLTDRQINNYTRTIKNQSAAIKARLTTDLLGNENGRLNDSIWNMVMKSDNPSQTMDLIATAAKNISGVGEADTPENYALEKVIGPNNEILNPRKSANAIAYAENNPDLVSPATMNNPTPEEIGQAASGYSFYRDDTGQLHVLPGNDYADRTLKTGSPFKNFGIYLQTAGVGAGRVFDSGIYPVLGDLGEVSLAKDGTLMVGGEPFKFTQQKYSIFSDDPLAANARFVQAKLTRLPVEDGVLNIAAGDLPTLEAAVNKGFKGQVVYGGTPAGISGFGQATATQTGGPLQDILLQAKQEARQALVETGTPFDKIARTLNVTRDFAESGTGDGYNLGAVEDHTQPMYAKIDYQTGMLPDKFQTEGIASLQQVLNVTTDMNKTVSAYVLGDGYNLLPNLGKGDDAGTFLQGSLVPGTQPNLNTFTKFASGEYGSLESYMQQVGKVAKDIKQQRVTAVQQALAGPRAALEANPAAMLEANILYNTSHSWDQPHFLITKDGAAMHLSGSSSDMIGNYVVPKDFMTALNGSTAQEAADMGDLLRKGIANKSVYAIRNDEVADWANATQKVNDVRIDAFNKMFAAKGSSTTYEIGQLYFGPHDTQRFPYVAFVKERMDLGAGDMKGAGIVAADTPESLQEKIAQIERNYGGRFEVVDKTDIKNYRIAQGDYEDHPFLGQSMADAMLRKEGLLYEFQPRLDDEFLKTMDRWHWNQENLIIHQGIELNYAQEFAQLRTMASNYQQYAEDRFGTVDKRSLSASNPYMRYINTALDRPSVDPNSIWERFNGAANQGMQKMFSVWDTMRNKVNQGAIDSVSANRYAESFGFTPPFDGVMKSVLQPLLENNRNIQGTIAKANGALATVTLGFDFLHSLLRAVSFPILGVTEMGNILRNLTDPTKVGALGDLTSVIIPGSDQAGGAGFAMPTPLKMLFRALASRWNREELAANTKYFNQIGAMRTVEQEFQDVVGAAQLTTKDAATPEALKGWTEKLSDKVQGWAEVGKTITGYNKSEEVVRYVAAHMMKQITDLAGIAAEDAPAYINSYVNRTVGNFMANQRPQLFQGVLGQAISLFQGYQFNMAQNLIRYMQGGDKAAVATLLGLQNTLFGMSGNPAFYALNKAVGNASQDHKDIIDSVFTVAGSKDPTDFTNPAKWILYGLGANATQTSLYNRAHLTPRFATIVPVSVPDIPLVSVTAKAISAFIQSAGDILKGGDVVNSLLNGLAHQGANRPLAGLAQLAAGYRTSSKGDLLSAYNDLSAMTVAAKIAGGEEINRAIALDQYERTLAYRKQDIDTINSLGQAVKTTMYAGKSPSADQVNSFMNQYVNAGGNPKGFNRWMMNMNKGANQSQINALAQHVNSRSGQQMQSMLGGDVIPDFWNASQTTGMTEATAAGENTP